MTQTPKHLLQIDPLLLTPHYSTKIWRGYYHYVCRNYSEAIFDKVLEGTGVPKSYLLRDGNWVSNRFSLAFMERLERETCDSNIAEKVGRHNFSPENINPFEYAILQIITPSLFFRIFPYTFAKMNRKLKVSVTKSGQHDYLFRLISTDQEVPDKSVCSALTGTLLAAKEFYRLREVTVNHTCCIHRGQADCIFEVHAATHSAWNRKVPKAAAILTALSFAAFSCLALPTNLLGSIGWAITVALVAALVLGFRRTYELFRNYTLHLDQAKEMHTTLHSSHLKLDQRYREHKLLRELSLKLVTVNSVMNLLEFTADGLESKFGYPKMFIMLLNREDKQLCTVLTRGLRESAAKIGSLALEYPDKRVGVDLIFPKILENGKTVFVSDIEKFKEQLKPENQLLVSELDTTSLVVAPLQTDALKFGLLIVGSTLAERKLNNDDVYLLENVTRMVSTYLANARQFEKEKHLRIMFQKFVPSMVLHDFGLDGGVTASTYVPQLRNIGSMFIDLRGFTAATNQSSPERVVQLLNLYFEFATKIVVKHGGIVDNLVGDGIVAFFLGSNSPRTTNVHRSKILACGVEFVETISIFNQLLLSHGFQEMGIGLGVNVGNALVGTVGSEGKLSYTALGDTVNLASRLQEYSKKYYSESNRAVLVVSDEVLKSSEFENSQFLRETVSIRGFDRVERIGVLYSKKAPMISKVA